MATTMQPNQPRPAQAQPVRTTAERSNYGAIWAILALIVLGAIAYGFYSTNETTDTMATTPMAQTDSATPSTAADADTSGTTMERTTTTPSDVTPGSPDTSSSEGTLTPTESVE